MTKLGLLATMWMTALLAAGCSDDDAGGGSGSDPGIPCSVMSTAEVRSTLAQPGIGEPVTNKIASNVNECAYPEGDVTLKVTIRYHVDIDDAYWETVKKGFVDHDQPLTPETGLGDQAFSSATTNEVFGFTVVTILARKGSRFVQLTSDSTLEQSRALAASILTRI